MEPARINAPTSRAVNASHRTVEHACAYKEDFYNGKLFSVVSLLLAITGIVVSILVVTLHTDTLKQHITVTAKQHANAACNDGNGEKQ